MSEFLWRIIFGKCVIRFKKTNAEEAFSLIRDYGIVIDKLTCTDDNYVIIIPESELSEFRSLADHICLEYEFERLNGIPKLYNRYKHRPGIIVGLILFLCITYFSGKIIWDFDITGNETVSDIEIISALEAVGCRAGAVISTLDFASIQNSCLVDTDSLAWISVNMDGNLAKVEVREKRVVPEMVNTDSNKYANIVAAEDGVIELCKVHNGKSVVYRGNLVRKGDLLITGVINLGDDGVRYEYADGEVMATVYREIKCFVPFDYESESPTGRKKTEYSAKIFGKSTNILPKGRIDYKLYGKIIETEKMSLPFGITLPVWITKTVYMENHVTSVRLSEEEALKLCKNDAYSKLSEMSDSLQLLSVDEECGVSDEGVNVILKIYGVTDISAYKSFSVTTPEN